jgi:hypothetical protein
MFSKLFALVSAAESAVSENPGSLQTAKVLIRLIVDVGKQGHELRTAIHALNAEVDRVRAAIAAGDKLSVRCGGGGGSFRRRERQERAKPKETYREPLATIQPEHLRILATLQKRSGELGEMQTLFRQIVDSLVTIRENWIGEIGKRHMDKPKTPFVHKAKSAYHADLISMILASRPDRQWGERLADKHHFDSLHGHVLHYIAQSEFRIPREPRNVRHSVRGTNENCRISETRGRDCWESRYLRPSPERIESDLRARLKTSQTRGNSRLYGFWQRMTEKSGDFRVFPQFANVTCILNALRYCKESGIEPDSLPSLKRLRNSTFASSEPGFREYVLTRPEIVESNVSLEWTTSENESVQAWHSVRYSIARVWVAPENGEPCWEYGFCRNPDLPEDMRNILRRVQPVHVSESGLQSRGESAFPAILQELRNRLRLAINPPYRMNSATGNSPEYKRELRRTVAAYCRKLLRIPVLTIQDSLNTGNCAPGTAQFCRELGIAENTISGRDMVKAWRRGNYPLNSLFLRVVDSVVAKSESAVTA